MKAAVKEFDSLVEMFAELRDQRPVFYDRDLWLSWEEAYGQVIAEMGTPEQRWAAIVLIAHDLNEAIPSLTLSVAYGHVRAVVERAQRQAVSR